MSLLRSWIVCAWRTINMARLRRYEHAAPTVLWSLIDAAKALAAALQLCLQTESGLRPTTEFSDPLIASPV